MKTGRPRTCDCGTCPKCRHRENARRRYQALSIEERREFIARRDKEKTRAADRARYYRHREERLARMAEWAKKNPARAQEFKRAHAGRYPEKTRARYTLGNAIRDGRVVRQPCAVCGEPRTQGHHYDYSRPLDVTWLCATHHGEAHRIYAIEEAA